LTNCSLPSASWDQIPMGAVSRIVRKVRRSFGARISFARSWSTPEQRVTRWPLESLEVPLLPLSCDTEAGDQGDLLRFARTVDLFEKIEQGAGSVDR
jgi:hypothetical protein